MSISLRDNKTRRICTDALFIAAAMMLSYLEFLIPLRTMIPLPGFKLGLANIATLAVFVLISKKDAAVVLVLRVALMGLLFGSAVSLLFSASGALLSYLSLLLASRFLRRCSYIGVSVLCAVFHNVGQILAATCLFGSEIILSYLPVLFIAALISGSITGLLLNLSVNRLERSIKR